MNWLATWDGNAYFNHTYTYSLCGYSFLFYLKVQFKWEGRGEVLTVVSFLDLKGTWQVINIRVGETMTQAWTWDRSSSNWILTPTSAWLLGQISLTQGTLPCNLMVSQFWDLHKPKSTHHLDFLKRCELTFALYLSGQKKWLKTFVP